MCVRQAEAAQPAPGSGRPLPSAASNMSTMSSVSGVEAGGPVAKKKGSIEHEGTLSPTHACLTHFLEPHPGCNCSKETELLWCGCQTTTAEIAGSHPQDSNGATHVEVKPHAGLGLNPSEVIMQMTVLLMGLRSAGCHLLAHALQGPVPAAPTSVLRVQGRLSSWGPGAAAREWVGCWGRQSQTASRTTAETSLWAVRTMTAQDN